MLSVACGTCGHTGEIEARHAGLRLRCSQCGQTMRSSAAVRPVVQRTKRIHKIFASKVRAASKRSRRIADADIEFDPDLNDGVTDLWPEQEGTEQ